MHQNLTQILHVVCVLINVPVYGDADYGQRRDERGARWEGTRQGAKDLPVGQRPPLVGHQGQGHRTDDRAEEEVADGKVHNEDVLDLRKNVKRC